jgi:hypothetical protein
VVYGAGREPRASSKWGLQVSPFDDLEILDSEACKGDVLTQPSNHVPTRDYRGAVTECCYGSLLRTSLS